MDSAQHALGTLAVTSAATARAAAAESRRSTLSSRLPAVVEDTAVAELLTRSPWVPIRRFRGNQSAVRLLVRPR